MEMIKIRKIARETIQVLSPAEERYFDIFWKVMSPWIEKENQSEFDRIFVRRKRFAVIDTLCLISENDLDYLTPKILAVLSGVLIDMSNPYGHIAVEKILIKYVRKYDIQGVLALHLIKHIPVLLDIPGSLDEFIEWIKIMPEKKKEIISQKQVKEMPKQCEDYKVLLNLKYRRLYLPEASLRVQKTPLRCLYSIIMRNGKACSFSDIVLDVWKKELTDENEDKLIGRIYPHITYLRSLSIVLKENIISEKDEGYRATGPLLEYCVLDRK